MDFSYTPDQHQFRQVLRDFVNAEIIPVARDMEESGEYPTQIVEGLKRLGVFGATVPEEYGGLGLGPVSFALIFEELSRGWMGVAGILGSHTMACRLIAVHGTEEQKRRYLAELATGQRRSGLALTEAEAGSDMQSIRTTARLEGDHYRVNGSKMWITNARHADPLPVVVKTDPTASPAHRGMSVLLIEQGTPGFQVLRDIAKLGYKGPETCEILFEDVRVPAANLVGDREGRGMQQVLSCLEWGRLNIAARSVGVAQRAYDEAVRYARVRQAFGRPIAEFQAIQLKLASMAINVQSARLMTYWAAQALESGRADGETGMAKIYASEAAWETTMDSMRVHGGYGYSKEFEIERLYRDAPLMNIGEGTNDILRTVVAASILRGSTTV